MFYALASIGASIATPAAAQAPSIGSSAPLAVKPGASVDVRVQGGNLTGAKQLLTTFPAQAMLAPDVPENGQKPDHAVFRVTVPAEGPVGIHGFRVVAAGGVSPLKLIVVDDLPSVPQQANNNTPEAAQPITPPVAVDGAVTNLGRHYFKFAAQAGQKIAIEVLARRIGSPLDPTIRLLDARGRELAFSDDEPGLQADARLSHTFAAAGEYVIEVRDIRYQGGDGHRFRLRVGDFPGVTVPYPMAVKRGAPATIALAGEDVEGVEPLAIQAPSDPSVQWMSVSARRPGGQSSGFATVAISDTDEVLEAEPNDAAENATRVPLGAGLNGRFHQPGDVDRFVFTAKQGQKVTFRAVTRQQGSPADLYLQLLKPDGSKLAEAEDAAPHDAVLIATFPADGDYALVVEELARQGGSAYAYRIEALPADPGFSLTATADTLNVPAGGAAIVTVNAARRDYGGPIAVEAVGLPQGVTSGPAIIGPGQNSTVLTLQSAPETGAGSASPVSIIGAAKIGDRDVRATATITDAIKPALSGLPWPPLTVATATASGTSAAPPFALRAAAPELVFGKSLSAKVKVTAARQAGFDEPIAVAVTPEKNGLPGGVTAPAATIAQGQSEVEVTFAADDKAPLGDFTAVLIGSLKKGNDTHTQPVPAVRLKLAAPMTPAVDAGAAKLARGGELKLNVKVERNPALSGPVELSLQNLPKGVTAANVTLAADQTETEVTLAAAADAAAGAANNIVVRGTATAGSAKLTADSAAVSITVE